ncbi:MAG: hypothetical protein ACW96U_00670 [Candidatus Heimdallarchaeaceae archaeon]|jgi:hypothetical protein
MNKSKYLESGGDHCPFCVSRNIAEQEDVETVGVIAWQWMECYDCGEEWKNEYKLVNIST